jgi:hypothetical protein
MKIIERENMKNEKKKKSIPIYTSAPPQKKQKNPLFIMISIFFPPFFYSHIHPHIYTIICKKKFAYIVAY